MSCLRLITIYNQRNSLQEYLYKVSTYQITIALAMLVDTLAQSTHCIINTCVNFTLFIHKLSLIHNNLLNSCQSL